MLRKLLLIGVPLAAVAAPVSATASKHDEPEAPRGALEWESPGREHGAHAV
jgi:hypothetical protein